MKLCSMSARGDRNLSGRQRLGIMLSTVLLLASWGVFAQTAVVAQQTMAFFTIDETVSAEDADAIVEGIHLAQDFFIEEIGATVDREVHVTVLPGADQLDFELVAASMGRSIIVYTGSWGWQQSAPSEKIGTIVHEYTHYYQYLMTGLDNTESPAWFEEGIAEYLSLVVLSDLQIVDRADIESYRASQLFRFPPNRTLSELESFSEFNEIGAAGYPLAHFGVSKLLEDTGLEAVRAYYSLLAAGLPFHEAFTLTFGLTPHEHYQRFDLWLGSLSGASDVPEDVAIYEAAPQESPVRVVEMPDRLVPDEQFLVRARTVEASACSLTLIPYAGVGTLLERNTFADGDGDVFWLVTILPDMPYGLVTIEIECGGEAATGAAFLESAA